jgi:hypothetical protein
VEKPQYLHGIRLPPDSEVQRRWRHILDYRQLPKVWNVFMTCR